MEYVYTAVFSPVDEQISVTFPDFPEVSTVSDNLTSALAAANDILTLYLFDLEQREKPINKPTLPHEIFVGEGQFTSTILANTSNLTAKFDGKYSNVKTIMSTWLFNRAKKNNLDLSLLLESAVRTELGLQAPRAVYPLEEEPAPLVYQPPKVATKASYAPFIVLAAAIVAIFLGVVIFLLWGDIQERILSITQSNEARVPFPAAENDENDEENVDNVEEEIADEDENFDGTYFDQSQNITPEEEVSTELLSAEVDVAEIESEEDIENTEDAELIGELAKAVRQPREHFLQLRESFGNDDIVGHLIVDGTSIDYVVVQAEDNDFYLTHDIWRNRASAGWVFLDYMADLYNGNPNTVIFGHNTAQDIMFHSLRKYRDRAFFDENSIIRFSTLYGDYIWEIFSFYATNVDFPYTNVEFGNDWEHWLTQFAEKSMHPVDIDVTAIDRILTLSTCTNVDSDERYVVHARLVN
ncbi:MAG: class B sortase [Firmicutes bacterium]|nr:class B sortase [Bacillota bacterium]